MAISALKIEFIRENKGKISLREMAKVLGISYGSVSHYARDKKYPHNPEVKRAYYKKNKKRCNEHSKKSYLKYRDERIAKMKSAYHEKKRIADTRTWEQRVDDGIETYHFVMRVHRLPRKVVYQRLIAEMKEQRMRKAA